MSAKSNQPIWSRHCASFARISYQMRRPWWSSKISSLLTIGKLPLGACAINMRSKGMPARKQTRSLAVFRGDGEFLKAELPDTEGKVFRHLSRFGKFADSKLGGHLPRGSGPNEHFGVER